MVGWVLFVVAIIVPNFKWKRTAPNAAEIRFTPGSGPYYYVMLRGDAHHDNPDSDRELELNHLGVAKSLNAAIIDNGDLFCAMQGKYDPRSSKDKVRPENQRGDYLDSLVRSATELYAPFANRFIGFGLGNHETSIYKRHETDLTDRMCTLLSHTRGVPNLKMGYSSWYRFVIPEGKVSRIAFTVYAVHGWGGGGAVTRNMIQAGNRIPMMVEGADVIVVGHTHDGWECPIKKKVLDRAGCPKDSILHIVQCPSYKNEYKAGEGGWHVETGKPPKWTGCYMLRLSLARESGGERRYYAQCDVKKMDRHYKASEVW